MPQALAGSHSPGGAAQLQPLLVLGDCSPKTRASTRFWTSPYFIQCLAPLNVSQLAAHQSLSKKYNLHALGCKISTVGFKPFAGMPARPEQRGFSMRVVDEPRQPSADVLQMGELLFFKFSALLGPSKGPKRGTHITHMPALPNSGPAGAKSHQAARKLRSADRQDARCLAGCRVPLPLPLPASKPSNDLNVQITKSQPAPWTMFFRKLLLANLR